MPTRPESPDPSGRSTGADAGAYAGLSFFQDWMKAASSALPHLTGANRHTGSAWTLPTLDPEELDKRIQDLKTVQFWLEQNARMIGMTIQTLEVQRMTLNTLRSMNMPMDAVRDSLKAGMAGAQGPAEPAPEAARADTSASATEPSSGEAEAAPAANPLQWWNTLTQQFTTLAQQAVQAGQDAVAATAPNLTPDASASAPSKATPKARATASEGKAPRKTSAARKPRPRST